MQIVLTTEILLEAYRHGLFPMAQSAESTYVHWICPDMRGQLSIEALHIPRRLAKEVRQQKIGGVPYEITVDQDFAAVIGACGRKAENRADTWINPEIFKAYCALHDAGHAHSVECWQNGELAGGLYGVSIGRAFFGESMFSVRRDASKVSLIHLVARLWRSGYKLLDTQFVNSHLEQFGVYEIPYADYMLQLEPALKGEADFTCAGFNEKQIVSDYFKMRKML
ncbi:MAG: leucyl/phenylalanyl-tRNA--protein transferase [Alphaproteobacteria bacterium]|nr:leucyl/phenylalanyl-tRNA--protein transferase [Alphaproteobacteria bacterium]